MNIIYNIIIILLIFLIYRLWSTEKFISPEGIPLVDEIKRRNKILVDFIYHKYKNDKDHLLRTRAVFLHKNYNPDVIIEHTPNMINSSTSYVEQKGKEIGYCLKTNKKLEEINTMMYVSIHELTHIYSYDILQHPKTFFDNFKFLLEEGVRLGLYKPVDYNKYPINYCGLDINSTVLTF